MKTEFSSQKISSLEDLDINAIPIVDVSLPLYHELASGGMLPQGPVCPWPKDPTLELYGIRNLEINVDMDPEFIEDIRNATPEKPIEITLVNTSSQPEVIESIRTTQEKYPELENPVIHDTAVKASIADMAKGLTKNLGYAIKNGRVSKEIREERYSICKSCPHFIEDSKRCSECGCFMETKTWIGANPKYLCPKNKWPK